MLRWFALATLTTLAAVAVCVSAADAQRQLISITDISEDFENIGGSHGNERGTITGMWSDGTTLWVMEDIDIRHNINSELATNDTGRILAYHLENLTRIDDGSKDFVYLAGADSSSFSGKNRSPDGIYSDGKTMWVGDSIHSPVKVFAYNMATKAHDSAKDYNIGSAPLKLRSPAGMWGNGTTMWIVDYADPEIYTFDITGTSISLTSEKISKDRLDSAENRNPWGIWSDGTTMWVADDGKDYVFAYRLSDKSRDQSKEFRLHEDNKSPTGLYSDGDTIWVLDNGRNVDPPYPPEKIFAYKLHPTPSSTRVFVYVPPPDTTPPTVKSVERTGNATTTDRVLTWEVTFSEPVTIRTNIHTNFTQHSPQGAVHIHAALRTNIHTNYTAVANAAIPDLGAAYDTISVDLLGVVTGGSVSVDLDHPITSDLLIELVAPDCTKFTIHNQTTTFPYKLRQPYDLGDLSGVGAAGQWTLYVHDRAKYWNGTLNGWTLYLESRGVVEGSGRTYAITQYVAGPGEYTLSLDGFDIRDRAGNHLRDADPAVNEPYHVVGAARTCQTE